MYIYQRYQWTEWLNCVRLHIKTCPIYRHTDWLVDMCMYKHVQYIDRQGGMSNMQTDRMVYMYQRVQYVNRQGCIHVNVPKCPINRQTNWFTYTCTNVLNLQTGRHWCFYARVPTCPVCRQTGLFHKHVQCAQYASRQDCLHAPTWLICRQRDW